MYKFKTDVLKLRFKIYGFISIGNKDIKQKWHK